MSTITNIEIAIYLFFALSFWGFHEAIQIDHINKPLFYASGVGMFIGFCLWLVFVFT